MIRHVRKNSFPVFFQENGTFLNFVKSALFSGYLDEIALLNRGKITKDAPRNPYRRYDWSKEVATPVTQPRRFTLKKSSNEAFWASTKNKTTTKTKTNNFAILKLEYFIFTQKLNIFLHISHFQAWNFHETPSTCPLRMLMGRNCTTRIQPNPKTSDRVRVKIPIVCEPMIVS